MVHQCIVCSVLCVWNLETVGLNGIWRSVLYGIPVSNFLPPIRNSDKVTKISR